MHLSSPLSQLQRYETLYGTQTGRDSLLFMSTIDPLFSFTSTVGSRRMFFCICVYIQISGSFLSLSSKTNHMLDKFFATTSSTTFVHMWHHNQHNKKVPQSSFADPYWQACDPKCDKPSTQTGKHSRPMEEEDKEAWGKIDQEPWQNTQCECVWGFCTFWTTIVSLTKQENKTSAKSKICLIEQTVQWLIFHLSSCLSWFVVSPLVAAQSTEKRHYADNRPVS